MSLRVSMLTGHQYRFITIPVKRRDAAYRICLRVQINTKIHETYSTDVRHRSNRLCGCYAHKCYPYTQLYERCKHLDTVINDHYIICTNIFIL